MIAHKLQNTRTTAEIISRFFLLDHVFQSSDPQLQSFMGIYDLIEDVRAGRWHGWAILKENQQVAGIGVGELVDYKFFVHLAFARKTNFRQVARALLQAIIDDLKPSEIVGLIPKENRASQLVARSTGFKISEEYSKAGIIGFALHI